MRQDLEEELRDHFQDAADAIHASIRDGKVARLQSLLGASPTPDLNRAHEKYGPPLHFAAWCGDINAVELLLAAGADPMAISRAPISGRPIGIAAKNGHRDVVKCLWSHDAQEIELKKRESDDTALRLAATNGHARIVDDLLAWDGWRDDHKACAFAYAAGSWRFKVITVFLKNNTFPQSTVKWALEAALDARAWGGPHPYSAEGYDCYNLERLIELLIDTLPAITDYENYDCSYLVPEAVSNANFTGALKTLLKKGVDVDWQDGGGWSALHILASPVPVGRWGNERYTMNDTAIKLLLQRGASVTTPNSKGDSPIHLAAQGSDLNSFRIFLSSSTRQDEDERTLLSSTNVNQETLLHYAAAGCQIYNMEYLISQGLNVNARNSNGWTPLMCALTPKNVIVNSKQKAINTPAGATEAALLLLSHGADPTIATHEGWTSLHALALHCDLDIRGKIADLATQFIARGVNPAACALLISPGGMSGSYDNGMPWGHRLPEAIMNSFNKLMIMQPNLTPLHWAAQRGAVGVVRALLAAGVDITIMDAGGMSAAAMALEIKAVPMLAEASDAITSLLL